MLFFPSRTSCGAMYPSFTLALFLVSLLSLSPQIYQVQKVGLARFHSCLHAFPPCESCYNSTITEPFRLPETSKILESNPGNPLKSERCPAGWKCPCNSAHNPIILWGGQSGEWGKMTHVRCLVRHLMWFFSTACLAKNKQ